MSINQIDRPADQNDICQICFIKFNELDEHQTIADKIRLDLSYLYNASHFHSSDVLKVKIEPVDVPSPDHRDNDHDDNDMLESDFNPDCDLDESDSDSSSKQSDSEKFTRVRVAASSRSRKKRSLRQKGDLSGEHIKEHSLNGQIVYQCMVCKKTTSKKGAIRQHVRIHTSERNICCPECGKMFKTPSCLYSHKKIHQKNNRMIW
jgi:DNA-directed RNA polymerase subunit RPC12/RpoP